jgi:hypothetical protein
MPHLGRLLLVRRCPTIEPRPWGVKTRSDRQPFTIDALFALAQFVLRPDDEAQTLSPGRPAASLPTN